MVVELENVSRAAARLGIAQPAVSSHLKNLAEKIGAPLFQRQGRKMRLTETGVRVHNWASEMVSRTRELERELDDGPGSAMIGASMTVGSYVLPALLSKFRAAHPIGTIDLRISTPTAIIDAIHAGLCDFAYTLLSQEEVASGLNVRHIYDEDLVLVCSPAMEISSREVALDDLNSLPFVSAPSNSARREIEDQLLLEHGVERKNTTLALEHAEAIKSAVRSGAGYALLLRSSVQVELNSGILKESKVDGLHLAVPINLVQRNGKRLSKFQTRLRDELTHQLQAFAKTGQD